MLSAGQTISRGKYQDVKRFYSLLPWNERTSRILRREHFRTIFDTVAMSAGAPAARPAEKPSRAELGLTSLKTQYCTPKRKRGA